ncbi:MAG: hypothetical protein QGG02_05640 [Gammaproteobacteria bacterium]|jgi:hypothetical protein|nr:hypothetical protein [Gammaproteobacteria bacterium]MDP6731305.1 hypothetical protein [Gammaproteobacteria bacterium]
MRNSTRLLALLVAVLFSSQLLAQQGNARGTIGESPYNVIRGWAKPFQENGFAFGGNSGILAESPDRIIIAQRGETVLPYPVPEDFPGYAGFLGINVLQETNRRTWQNCLYTVNGDGEVQEIWTQWDYLCEGSAGPGPHRVRISPYDPERKIWLVNETFHQIYVFSNDGSELLATYGEKGVQGDDGSHFGRPQDVTFLPDGRILIADGLDNHRVMIMDNDMNYLGEFGGLGDGPGQFDTIHAIAIGPEGRIFVLDRRGGEVNLFRTTDDPAVIEFERSIGSPLTLPLDIIVNENDFWITDLGPLRFINFDFEGNLKYTWLVPRELPDGYIEVHTFSVDSEGNLYGGDNQYGRTQKFLPKPGASADLLIEPPWVAN